MSIVIWQLNYILILSSVLFQIVFLEMSSQILTPKPFGNNSYCQISASLKKYFWSVYIFSVDLYWTVNLLMIYSVVHHNRYFQQLQRKGIRILCQMKLYVFQWKRSDILIAWITQTDEGMGEISTYELLAEYRSSVHYSLAQ